MIILLVTAVTLDSEKRGKDITSNATEGTTEEKDKPVTRGGAVQTSGGGSAQTAASNQSAGQTMQSTSQNISQSQTNGNIYFVENTTEAVWVEPVYEKEEKLRIYCCKKCTFFL